MKLNIEYRVEDHGWAIVTFSYGDEKVEYAVSYLHDSLKDLALLARDVKKGKESSRAVFMDEPGEIQFKVSSKDNNLSFQVLAYKDWQSWGMDNEENGELLMNGYTSPNRIIHQVNSILRKIHEEIGPEKYKQLWVEHEFPIELYRELADA